MEGGGQPAEMSEPELRTALRSMSQWLFELEHLFKTPSQDDDHKLLQDELQERMKGVDFMFRVGLSLGLPLTPLYTAATYLHRFYMRHSLEDYNYHEVAIACLYLAAKIEETSRKIADTARMAMVKARGLDPDKYNFSSDDSKREIERWQTNILTREEILVDTLCFEFVVRHPQTCLAHMFARWPQELRTSTDPADDFIQGATWTVANDAFRTPICVLAPPHVAALACFLVAAHVQGLGTLDDFLIMHAERATDACVRSYAVCACELLDVRPADFQTVMDCMTLLRDYYASTLEQAGRYAFIEELASLPLPNRDTKFFAPCPPSVLQNGLGYTNGSTMTNGDLTPQTPRSDGSKTPGAFSVGGLSQASTVDSS